MLRRFIHHALTLLAIAVLAGGVWPIGGCVAIEAALSPERKPTLRVQDVQIHGLSLERATLLFDVEVTNHYRSTLPLLGTECVLSVQGQRLLGGMAGPVPSLAPGASRTVQVPMEVRYADLHRAIQSIHPGAVVDYAADLTFWFDAPVLGRMSTAKHYEGKLPVPAVPEVQVAAIDWPSVTWNALAARVHLRVRNTNEFPVDFQALNCRVELGRAIALAGEVDCPHHLEPGQWEEMDLVAGLSLKILVAAGATWTKGQPQDYLLSGSCRLTTPYGGLDLPLAQAGRTSGRKWRFAADMNPP
jgi:LEA14-like dessication related protein